MIDLRRAVAEHRIVASADADFGTPPRRVRHDSRWLFNFAARQLDGGCTCANAAELVDAL